MLSSIEEEVVEKYISCFLWSWSFKNIVWSRMLVLACNSSTWKSEVGRWVQCHLSYNELYRPWERRRKQTREKKIQKKERFGPLLAKDSYWRGKFWAWLGDCSLKYTMIWTQRADTPAGRLMDHQSWKGLSSKLSLKENCHLTTQMDNQIHASYILGFVPKRDLKG